MKASRHARKHVSVAMHACSTSVRFRDTPTTHIQTLTYCLTHQPPLHLYQPLILPPLPSTPACQTACSAPAPTAAPAPQPPQPSCRRSWSAGRQSLKPCPRPCSGQLSAVQQRRLCPEAAACQQWCTSIKAVRQTQACRQLSAWLVALVSSTGRPH
eukprot:363560-Chlamydomonas_euryale.AAC.2